jgi:hypothetical protein
MPEPLPGSGDEAEESMRKNPVVQQGDEGRSALSAGTVAAIVLALAAAGCGRNGGDLPVGFTPVGVAAQDNVLVVEVVEEAVDPETSVPVVQAVVLDRTVADGYRLYRQVGGGGFATANDYVSNFIGTYNQGYETYTATDREWDPTQPRVYMGRATVQGKESSFSPLTNTATVPPGEVDDLLAGSFLTVCPIDTSATDSLPLMVWEPVAGAARYAIEIVRTDRRVFFFGLTPPNGAANYQLGSHAGTLFQEVPLSPSTFFWTVLAIDADSRIIGRSDRQIFVCDPLDAEPPCTP